MLQLIDGVENSAVEGINDSSKARKRGRAKLVKKQKIEARYAGSICRRHNTMPAKAKTPFAHRLLLTYFGAGAGHLHGQYLCRA